MTWQGDPRTSTHWWRRLRQLILERDNHQCQWPLSQRTCGQPANEVDHRTPITDGGTNDPTNLWSLCRWHHGQKTSTEGNAARQRLARTPEKHPGLTPRAPTPTT